MNQDVRIGQGDDAPAPTWQVANGFVGPFQLEVLPRAAAEFVRRSDDGGLAFDPATGLLTWPITTAESAALPLGRLTSYRLREVRSPDVRIIASGFVVVSVDPVDPTAAQTVAAGPPGPSAYEVAVANGYAGTEQQWLASLASGAAAVTAYPIVAAASFTALHNLSYRPRAWLVDASGAEVETDILHGPGQVTAVFPAAWSGTLYLG